MVLSLSTKTALFALVAGEAFSQALSPSVQRLTVAIDRCYKDSGGKPLTDSGMGFIIADHKERADKERTLFIVTAAHVAPKGADVSVKLFSDVHQHNRFPFSKSASQAGIFQSCSVIDSQIDKEDGKGSHNEDFSLIACVMPASFRGNFQFSALGSEKELRLRAPVILSINDLPPEREKSDVCPPPSYPPVYSAYLTFNQISKEEKNATIASFNPLGRDVSGASGGPLLTERSQIVGMVYEELGQNHSEVRAFTWKALKQWLDIQRPGFDKKWVSLKNQASSGAELRRPNVEVSVDAATLYVPGFGWLATAPDFRISSAIAGMPSFRFSFDFVSSQGTTIDETVKLTLPSVTGEFHLGSVLSQTRRNTVLSGFYLAAGIAPASLTRTTDTQKNIQALTGIFDLGWRYRPPGRTWGIHASYREGVLHENPVGTNIQVYPRFRSSALGMFYVFK